MVFGILAPWTIVIIYGENTTKVRTLLFSVTLQLGTLFHRLFPWCVSGYIKLARHKYSRDSYTLEKAL